jgi:hypothetical protein
MRKNFELLNQNILAVKMGAGTWCWYTMRMDVISVMIMTSATLICIVLREDIDPVILSMVLAKTLELEVYTSDLLQKFGNIEKNMVSIQRCFKVYEIP